MFPALPHLHTPGLLITGTDTDVGKTVVTCAIAAALRRTGSQRVAVCKPFASGCRKDREGLVSPDAEALAHFADCRLPLETINPIRFRPPLAPAVASEQTLTPMPWDTLNRALRELDGYGEAMLIEGVGGVMVPIDPSDPGVTVLDLAAVLGYPAVVVARSVLGTLNHTAMTVRLLEQAGVAVAGIVMNGFDVDAAAQADPSVATNQRWLERMTGVPVLAMIPRVKPEDARPDLARLDPAVLDAVARVDWWARLGGPGA